jgi:hypothetical protein
VMVNRTLLLVARALLYVVPAPRAFGLTKTLAAGLPPLRSAEDARTAYASLVGHGSCLSRSIVVAARTPSARIAIGVDPSRSERLFAHAWVELNGLAIDSSDPVGEVMAYLPDKTSSPAGGSGATMGRRVG